MKDRIRIIIIDDEPIVGKRLKRVFEKEGYDVQVFTDSVAATKALETTPCDIIITDLKMENIDGMDILENVQQNRPGIKVIIITGVGKWLTATEAFNKGVFDFIIKPFKIEEIRDAVRRAAMESRD